MPDALKKLRGRTDRHPLDGVQVEIPVQAFASCPDWLPEVAQTEWRRQVSRMIKAGLLTPVDRATFTAYCLSWAGTREAQEHLKKEGMTTIITTANGSHELPSPYILIQKTYLDVMLKSARELGITPSARASIRIPKVPEKAKDDPLTPPRWIPPKMIAKAHKK